jgi:hypothetical protein
VDLVVVADVAAALELARDILHLVARAVVPGHFAKRQLVATDRVVHVNHGVPWRHREHKIV